MQTYRDLSDNSGIHSYECGPDWIKVWFKRGGSYVYDQVRPGPVHVERMKELAESGDGLGTYINQHVQAAYARRDD